MGEKGKNDKTVLNVLSIILAVFALIVVMNITYRRVKKIGLFLKA